MGFGGNYLGDQMYPKVGLCEPSLKITLTFQCRSISAILLQSTHPTCVGVLTYVHSCFVHTWLAQCMAGNLQHVPFFQAKSGALADLNDTSHYKSAAYTYGSSLQ